MRKLKILCLHGYRQNAEFFREKTGGFRKMLKKYADFVFMTAPHVPKVPSTNDLITSASDDNQGENGRGDVRGWWFSKPDNQFSSRDVTDLDTGFHESVKAVVDFAAKEGPFDGIFAFSQGAALAILIAALRLRKEVDLEFSFMVIVAGFPSLSSKHSELMATHLSGLHCLHVYGENDEVVDGSNSEKLVNMFDEDKREVIIHKGGHFVPPLTAYKDVVKNFMEKMQKLANESPSS